MVTYVKKFAYLLEAKNARRRAAPSKSILFPVFWVTGRCNLRCRMCDQWKADPGSFARELTTTEWFGCIDSVSRMHAAVLVLTGGEPLLRGDIFDIIKHARERGIAVHLCSNGTLLEEACVTGLRQSGVNTISVSLDHYEPKIHEDLRGTACFNAVVGGIRLLKRTAPRIKVGINCLITKANFRGISAMIPFAERLGVDQIKFDLVHTHLRHRHKPAASFDGLLLTSDVLAEFDAEMKRLTRAIRTAKIATGSSAFLEGLSGQAAKDRRLRCYAGYISCAIDAFGRVSACDNQDTEASVRDKSLEEIWRSGDLQSLRQRVRTCDCRCWDSTHAELNIRCSWGGLFKEPGRAFREARFYLS